MIKNPSPAFLEATSRYWKAAIRCLLNLLFSRLNKPSTLSLSSLCSHRPPLDSLQQVRIPLVLGVPELNTVLQVGSHIRGVEGKNCFLWPAGLIAFDATLDTVGLLGWGHRLLAHIEFIISIPESLSPGLLSICSPPSLYLRLWLSCWISWGLHGYISQAS